MSIKLIAGSVLNYLYNNLLTHFPSHTIRILFLRAFNRNIHSSAVILMHTRILNFWDVKVGERVVVNQFCLLDCMKFSITIQHDTDIGPYTRIWTLGHDPDADNHEVYGGDVHIGHHVWVASGVTILPGVLLADGSVVAAGAVVHRSTEPNDIIAGNPARVLRKRKNNLTYNLNYNPILE